VFRLRKTEGDNGKKFAVAVQFDFNRLTVKLQGKLCVNCKKLKGTPGTNPKESKGLEDSLNFGMFLKKILTLYKNIIKYHYDFTASGRS
jgi:hypothetical protein